MGSEVKYLSLLTILLFLMTIASIFTGQQQPPSTWSTVLHLTECDLPCWIDIVPGNTTMTEAERKLKQVYSNLAIYAIYEQEYSFKITHKPTGFSFVVTFRAMGLRNSAEAIVQEILIFSLLSPSANAKSPTIPDLYSSLGNPETVRLTSGAEREGISLQYKDQQVRVFLNDLECDRITLNQEINTISLIHVESMQGTWLSEPKVWRGFRYCYDFERTLS
jgi:hypothetical protein